MKLLVVGSGGREHALVWKLAQSPQVTALWCAPGNGGISLERLSSTRAAVECVPVAAEDLPRLLALAREKKPDLTVVGPDNPLALGIVDLFQGEGLRIWGPNRKAALFESSKAFAQEFMQRHGIPSPRAAVFSRMEEARKFAAELGGKCVVKADGLALGKGVLICACLKEAVAALEEMMVKQSFGKAGERVVIQELLEGTEVSLHALCDGGSYRLFPASQDHKRALDGDQGLNTGGMGCYSPVPFLSSAQLEECAAQVLAPWMEGCRSEGIDFRGIIYPGLMLTREGPKVLEFNARFGDPEAQVYLARLDNDLLELMLATLDGTLEEQPLRWKEEAAVCVVMASSGYPGNYAKGKKIEGLEESARLPDTKIFHAGTSRTEKGIITSGGRVLGVTSWAGDLDSARRAAYQAVEKIQFDGARFRRDIAAKALSSRS
jgi:phosphoribosylamine---glycine ligase